MAKKLLTLRQTSEKLAGRSRSQIYRDIATGVLPRPLKIGGRRYMIEDEIDEVIDAAAHAAAPEAGEVA